MSKVITNSEIPTDTGMTNTMSKASAAATDNNVIGTPGDHCIGPDELVWFVHLHKCAGTFVVKHAAEAGLPSPCDARNGNPLNPDGSYVDFGAMSGKALNRYLDRALASGTRFIASEFSYPDFEALFNRPEIRVITVIRDPFQRYVSNYRYDVGCGFTRARNIASYHRSAGAWTYFNYYMNVLSRTDSPADRFTEDEYRNASAILRRFDLVLSQDQTDFGERLAAFFGNEPITKRSNATKGLNWKMLLGRARRGNPLPLTRSLIAKKTVPDWYEAKFRLHNTYDIDLFNQVNNA